MNVIQKQFSLIGSLIISLLFPLFVLYSDANISGKVIDSTSTHPLSEIKVSLINISNEKIIQTMFTDSKGMYQFKDVSSGQYKVSIEQTDYVSVSANPLIVSVESSAVKANFSLGIPGSIMGQVKDGTTHLPIPGASIEVIRGNSVIMSILTDDQGCYRIDHLAPRPYIIRAKMSYFQASLQLAVPVSNQVMTLDFALQCSPGMLMGKIVDVLTGEPIHNATINLLNQGFVIDSVQSRENGSYTITEVVPGFYQVQVTAQKYASTMQSMALATKEELLLNFSLEPFGRVEGQVINQFTGQPIKGASVGMWQNEELFDATHTDQNGFFQLDGLKCCQIVVQALYFHDREQSVNITSNHTSTLNFTLPWKEPTPPKKAVVEVAYERYAHQLNRIHCVRWRESADPHVVAYRIYRDSKMIAEVSADKLFIFKDKWRSDKKKKYEVTAINHFGQESLPVAANNIED